MEYPFGVTQKLIDWEKVRLNPCFRGISFRRAAGSYAEASGKRSLNPCFRGISFRRMGEVLADIAFEFAGLNPCFRGISFRSIVRA